MAEENSTTASTKPATPGGNYICFDGQELMQIKSALDLAKMHTLTPCPSTKKITLEEIDAALVVLRNNGAPIVH